MSATRSRRPRRQPRIRGQGLVEFALLLPVFLLLVLGMIEGGRLVVAYNSVSQSAREAARVASVQAPFIGKTGSACTAPTCPGTTTELRSNVVAAAGRMATFVGTLAADNLHIACTALGAAPTGAWTGGNDCSASNASGNVVSVRVVVPLQALTPFFSPFMPGTLAGTATMAIP